MLKPIDIAVVLKICAIYMRNPKAIIKQNELAFLLCTNTSDICLSIERLRTCDLLRNKYEPNITNILITLSAIRHIFPAKVGTFACGIQCFSGPKNRKIVWPYSGEGSECRGWSLEPLHKGLCDSLTKNPDREYRKLISLTDHARVIECDETGSIFSTIIVEEIEEMLLGLSD